MLVYKQYDQAALDRQYNNRLHVPDFATYLERWKLLSSQTENKHHVIKDLSYGSLPREMLDIYPSAYPSSKTLIFIHGGYWHKLGKEYFQFIADAFHVYGITTVLINYPLAPSASMDQIVTSCKKAVCWVAQNIPKYNGSPGEIYVAGYSAGGHLAAMMMATEWKLYNFNPELLKGVSTISGLFNLTPIRLSDLNQILNMNEETAFNNSPALQLPVSHCALSIVVGGDETGEFLDQSMELYSNWGAITPAGIMQIKGLNHYSIMETLLEPASALHLATLRLLKI